MPSALPIVSDCNPSCSCAATNLDAAAAAAIAGLVNGQLVYDSISELKAQTRHNNKQLGIVRYETVPGDGTSGDFTYDTGYAGVEIIPAYVRPNDNPFPAAGAWVKHI